MSPMCWFQGDLIQTAERKTAMLTTLPFPALEHLEPSRLWSGGGASRTGAICCCLWCHGAFPSNGYDIVTFCWFLSQRYITDADETQCVSILHFFPQCSVLYKIVSMAFFYLWQKNLMCSFCSAGLCLAQGFGVRFWPCDSSLGSNSYPPKFRMGSCSDMLWHALIVLMTYHWPAVICGSLWDSIPPFETAITHYYTPQLASPSSCILPEHALKVAWWSMQNWGTLLSPEMRLKMKQCHKGLCEMVWGTTAAFVQNTCHGDVLEC